MEDKRILIVGTGTVAQAIAKRYLQDNCKVVFCDETQSKLDAALKNVPEASTCIIEKFTDADLVKNTITNLCDSIGNIDIFVYAVAYNKFKALDVIAQSEMKEARYYGLDAPFVFGQQMGNIFAEKGVEGFLLYAFNDSCEGDDELDPVRCGCAYGLKGLIRSFALTYGPKKIIANGIAAGYLDTPEDKEYRSLIAKSLDMSSEEYEKKCLATTLTGKLVDPMDVAEMCRFYTTEAVNISGQILLVDGGRQMY